MRMPFGEPSRAGKNGVTLSAQMPMSDHQSECGDIEAENGKIKLLILRRPILLRQAGRLYTLERRLHKTKQMGATTKHITKVKRRHKT